MSTAERRALKSGDPKTTVRLSDFAGVIPAITGKVELVYEGEQEGADFVAQGLIEKAIESLFPNYFPKIEKLEKEDRKGPYDDLIYWFFEGNGFELLDDLNDSEYQKILDSVSPLDSLIKQYQPDASDTDIYFLKEFILWGLVQFKKLSKYRFTEGVQFKDPYGSFIKGL